MISTMVRTTFEINRNNVIIYVWMCVNIYTGRNSMSLELLAKIMYYRFWNNWCMILFFGKHFYTA
jgi:hypothetical protein